MSPFEFVLGILFIVGIFVYAIVRANLNSRRHVHGGSGEQSTRLREDVERLQQRVQVLERIVTDGGFHTAAQIEELRDAPTPAAAKEMTSPLAEEGKVN